MFLKKKYRTLIFLGAFAYVFAKLLLSFICDDKISPWTM